MKIIEIFENSIKSTVRKTTPRNINKKKQSKRERTVSQNHLKMEPGVPKGVERRPKRGKRDQKGTQREPKGTKKGAKGERMEAKVNQRGAKEGQWRRKGS